jgi:glycosyltransferase involved in cell wall biosynthesis
MSNFPRISVITPSYNQGLFLEETIMSVLNQAYPNLEYIIMDGGSTDNSVDIIKKYASQLTYWESEKDRGFGHAINKGFEKATGEIVCWLNSDDLFLPGTLTIVAKYFNANADVDLVFGNRHVIDKDSKFLYTRDYFFYLPGQLKFGKTFPQECTFWRRKVFSETGKLDENLKYTIDLDLWCRISKAGRIRHIPFYLGAFRNQPQSKSSTIAHIGEEEKRSVITKYFNRYPGKLQMNLFQMMFGMMRRCYRAVGLTRIKKSSIKF